MNQDPQSITTTISSPQQVPVPPSKQINLLLDQLNAEKLKEIKAEKISSKATLTSRLNIEQTAHLKRLKMYIIIGGVLTLILLIAYAALSAYLEYKDIVQLINQYGQQANIPISGFKMALCLRYPPLTSWFFAGNSAFPEAVFIAYRTQAYNSAFVTNLPTSLSNIYTQASISTGDTSAAYLICQCDFAKKAGILSCETACNSSNSTNAASSALNGVNMGLSASMATAGLFPPFGFIAGFVAGFCGGFFTSQYPPGASDSLNQCIS
jgi:hypothetical protein